VSEEERLKAKFTWEFAMQLCTNVKLLLDMVAASGEPKLWELTPPEARKRVIELSRIVGCEERIGKVEDLTLPGPGRPYARTALEIIGADIKVALTPAMAQSGA
jgi:hypothetical protein